MEKVEQDVQEVQETSEEEAEETAEETSEETLTPEQIAELKKTAEVSSQNFERLKKEEQKRKELEAKIEKLEAKLDDSGDYSEDDDVLKDKLAELNAKLLSIEEKSQWDSVTGSYPVLKDKKDDFDEFRQEYPGIPLDKAAKLYVMEKGLYETPTKRKGLEKAGGGTRNVPSGKMSTEDVARLRKNNYKEYVKLLKAGKIQVND